MKNAADGVTGKQTDFGVFHFGLTHEVFGVWKTRKRKDVSDSGDGMFSFEEFVGIMSNMGAIGEATSAEDEAKELKDAFHVSFCSLRVLFSGEDFY
jgi:hypothetical protein